MLELLDRFIRFVHWFPSPHPKLELLAQKPGFGQQNPGFCAARAVIERHLSGFRVLEAKKLAVFDGACSNYFLRSGKKKNGWDFSSGHGGQPKRFRFEFGLKNAEVVMYCASV